MLPLEEALAPVYAALARSVLLLAAGLALASLAGLFLARRMVVPIRSLQAGAARIGGGELDQRIRIETGDELEDLAEQFNRMGERLQQLYSNLERVSQLKRYFSPHLAELIVSSEESILGESHRRDITVVFCDLRGFTAFYSSVTPEIVMQVLAAYYSCLGLELRRFEATIGHFAGDGLMAFFITPIRKSPDMFGVSIFVKDGNGDIFHSYSTYHRGTELLMGAFNWLDLAPKGRNETGGTMRWMRLHDGY